MSITRLYYTIRKPKNVKDIILGGTESLAKNDEKMNDDASREEETEEE